MTTGPSRNRRRIGYGLFIGGGVVVAFALAFAVSPYANPNLDGLEKVADEEAFAETADQEHDLAETPTAGYGVEGVDNEGLSTGLSGIIGVIVTFAVGLGIYGLVKVVGRRRSGGDDAGSSRSERAGQRAAGSA